MQATRSLAVRWSLKAPHERFTGSAEVRRIHSRAPRGRCSLYFAAVFDGVTPVLLRLRPRSGHASQFREVASYRGRRHRVASTFDRQLELPLQVTLLDHGQPRSLGARDIASNDRGCEGPRPIRCLRAWEASRRPSSRNRSAHAGGVEQGQGLDQKLVASVNMCLRKILPSSAAGRVRSRHIVLDCVDPIQANHPLHVGRIRNRSSASGSGTKVKT